MKQPIQFWIPWAVKAKQGDRVQVVTRPSGAVYAKHHTSIAVKQNANALAALMLPYRPESPLVGPLSLAIDVVFPWLSKHKAKTRVPGNLVWKATKPDADNLAKQVCDVLQAARFYAGDQQIASLSVTKRFGDAPQLGIRLTELGGK